MGYISRVAALHGLIGCEIREENLADCIAPLGQGSDGQAAGIGRGARTNRTRLWQGFDHEARITRGRSRYGGGLDGLARPRHCAWHRWAAAWPGHRDLWTGEFG